MLSLMFTEFVPIFARIVATFPKKETFSKKGDPICQKGPLGDPLKDSAEPCALAKTLNCRVVYFSDFLYPQVRMRCFDQNLLKLEG